MILWIFRLSFKQEFNEQEAREKLISKANIIPKMCRILCKNTKSLFLDVAGIDWKPNIKYVIVGRDPVISLLEMEFTDHLKWIWLRGYNIFATLCSRLATLVITLLLLSIIQLQSSHIRKRTRAGYGEEDGGVRDRRNRRDRVLRRGTGRRRMGRRVQEKASVAGPFPGWHDVGEPTPRTLARRLHPCR